MSRMFRGLRLSSEPHGVSEQPGLQEILFQNSRKEMARILHGFSAIKSPSSLCFSPPPFSIFFQCMLGDGTQTLTHRRQESVPCLLHPTPHSHFSLTSHPLFPSLLRHLPFSFLSAPSSAHISSAPFFSSHYLPCSCVPALGDPLPIHHYFHGYLAGFSVRSGRLESREVIECLYACREGLDYRDFESLGKGMKV